MATEDEVGIRITLRNAAKFQRDVSASSRGLREVGTSAKVAGVGLATIRSSSNAVGSGLRSIGSNAHYAAIGVGALAAVGAKWGIGFNSQVESSTVALTTLLGSQQKANTELLAGQQIAKSSALLNFRDTARAQQQLIAMGVNANLTRRLLEGTSDALVALGRDPQDFQQVINAFSQIQAKGTVMGDEITQQLGEVFPAMKILGEQLGLTGDQMRNIGAQGIDATTALNALATGLTKDFGGAAEAAQGTWTALMSRLQDDSQQAFGAITKTTFDWAEKAVLPAADRAAQAITEIFGQKGLSNDEKLRQAGRVIVKEMSPVWDQIGDAVGQADIPEKLGEVVKAATPIVLDAAVDVGKSAAGAFVTGWLHSGPWAQFLTVAFLGNKLRKSDIGKALGSKGGIGGTAGNLLGTRGATPGNPVFVSMAGAGALNKDKSLLDKAKKIGPLAAGTASRFAPALGVSASALVAGGGIAYLAATHNENFPTKGPGASSPSNPAGHVPFIGGGPQRNVTNVSVQIAGKEMARATAVYDQVEQGRLAASAAARR